MPECVDLLTVRIAFAFAKTVLAYAICDCLLGITAFTADKANDKIEGGGNQHSKQNKGKHTFLSAAHGKILSIKIFYSYCAML